MNPTGTNTKDPFHQKQVKEDWLKRLNPELCPIFETVWSLYESDLIEIEELKAEMLKAIHDQALNVKQPVVQKVPMYLTDTQKTTNEAIVKHLEKTTLHALQPWRIERDTLFIQWDQLKREHEKDQEFDLELAKTLFINKAKLKGLSTDDVIAGSYMFIMEDADLARRCYLHLMCVAPNSIKVKLHNYFILDEYSEGEQNVFGPKIPTLGVPLFPPYGELKNLNERIFEEDGFLEGGGEEVHPQLLSQFYRIQGIKGGEYTERVYNEEGVQISEINMANTDERLHALYDTIVKNNKNVLKAISTLRQTTAARAARRVPARRAPATRLAQRQHIPSRRQTYYHGGADEPATQAGESIEHQVGKN